MDLYDVIMSRRTIRKFKPDKLTDDQLLRYINAARVAPSAANLQPLRYVVVNRSETVDALFPLVRWAGYLKPYYNPKAGERPVAYVAVCADLTVKKTQLETDLGAAAENLILSALCDGVGACWIGAVDYEKAEELLGLDENIKLLSIIALGYPAEEPKEVAVQDDSIRYYLNGEHTLCVPKRSTDEVLIKVM